MVATRAIHLIPITKFLFWPVVNVYKRSSRNIWLACEDAVETKHTKHGVGSSGFVLLKLSRQWCKPIQQWRAIERMILFI